MAPRSAKGVDLELHLHGGVSQIRPRAGPGAHLLHGVGFQIRPWVGPGAPSPWRVGCIPTSAPARLTTPSASASAARLGKVGGGWAGDAAAPAHHGGVGAPQSCIIVDSTCWCSLSQGSEEESD